ncbi:MAG TPA: mechanosensitive ion channel family protein, partial [Aequorivita sp.]|nr:mechanosensitive ion channel family protein [Aequorivita sp.]
MNKETLQEYSCLLQDYLVSEGMVLQWAIFFNVIVNSIILLVGVTLIDIVFRKFIVEAFKAFSNKTKTTFDDYLVKSNF